MDSLTIAELAEAAGLTTDGIDRFVQNRVVEPDGDGRFRITDVARIRLVSALEDSGVDLADIGAALEAGSFSLEFVDQLMPEPVRLLPPLAEVTDLDELWTERVGPILGSTLGVGRPMRADDAALRALFLRAIDLDVPPERVVSIVRTTAQSVSRLVALQREFVDEVLLGPAIEETGSTMAALEATSATRYEYRRVGRELIMMLLERIVDDAIFDNLVQLSEATLARGGVAAAGNKEAVVFVDISRYTALSEMNGDRAAALQASMLIDYSQELAKAHKARLVKSLGDGAMFHAPDARSGLALALAAIGGTEDRGLWPLHAGVNVGAMVLRDGDLFGNAVNIASRIANEASAGQVVVTEDVAAELSGDVDVDFVSLGEVRLRNVSSPIPIYRAEPVKPSPGQGARGVEHTNRFS